MTSPVMSAPITSPNATLSQARLGAPLLLLLLITLLSACASTGDFGSDEPYSAHNVAWDLTPIEGALVTAGAPEEIRRPR